MATLYTHAQTHTHNTSTTRTRTHTHTRHTHTSHAHTRTEASWLSTGYLYAVHGVRFTVCARHVHDREAGCANPARGNYACTAPLCGVPQATASYRRVTAALRQSARVDPRRPHGARLPPAALYTNSINSPC